VSVVYPTVDAMLRNRGAVERADGSFAEDSYDYGVWWRDRRGGVYRLTWVGPQWRQDAEKAGELYLVRLADPLVGTVTLGQMRERGSMAASDFVDVLSAGAPTGPVELLCLIPPVPCDVCRRGLSVHQHDPQPDATVEEILEGWADACGAVGSVGWVRDRVYEALRAGWARPARPRGRERGDA
jgi:hypothetical protein